MASTAPLTPGAPAAPAAPAGYSGLNKQIPGGSDYFMGTQDFKKLLKKEKLHPDFK